jgi:hypothetical protein
MELLTMSPHFLVEDPSKSFDNCLAGGSLCLLSYPAESKKHNEKSEGIEKRVPGKFALAILLMTSK